MSRRASLHGRSRHGLLVGHRRGHRRPPRRRRVDRLRHRPPPRDARRARGEGLPDARPRRHGRGLDARRGGRGGGGARAPSACSSTTPATASRAPWSRSPWTPPGASSRPTCSACSACASSCCPGMRAQRWGRIVNVSSMGGRLTFPGGGLYHASKHAVEALSDALRFEVRPFGVEVVVVQPGLIRTGFGDAVDRRDRRRHLRRRAVRRLQPGRRGGDRATRTGAGRWAGWAARRTPSPSASRRSCATRTPRARYPVTASARVMLLARRLLPDAAWDAMMRRVYVEPGDDGARRPLPADLVALAERARAAGRLGIDTEFMPEGRYKPLLCLVQVVVGDEVVVLDPLEDMGDPAPLAALFADPAVEVVLHAGRQDVAILRREWRTDRSPTSSTRRSPRASPATPPRPATPACCTTCSRSGSPSRRPSPAGTRGRSRPEQLRYAREDVEHLPALADALQARLRERGRLGLGARGMPRDRRRDRRARSRGDVAPAAAHLRARRARAGGRPRARRLAGAHGRGRGPPRRRRRPRSHGGRAGQAPAAQRQGARRHPRRRARRAAPARAGHPRGDRARPRGAARCAWRRASGWARSRSTGRRSPCRRRSCGRARRRPGWPTS